MKYLRIFVRSCLLLILLTVVTGCAYRASGQLFKPETNISPDEAVVYIYWQDNFFHKAKHWSFWGNDQRLGLMTTNGYYIHKTKDRQVKYYAVSRGQYGEWTEALNVKDDLIDIKLEPGKEYYLRWDVGFLDFVSLKQVDESTGKAEIKDTRSIDKHQERPLDVGD